MKDSEMHLPVEYFDLCRICMEPKVNRDIGFYHIFRPDKKGHMLNEILIEVGLKINEDDLKPKIICHNCYKTVLDWSIKKKLFEKSDIVLSYLEQQIYESHPEILASNNTDICSHSRNNNEPTKSSSSLQRSQSNRYRTRLSKQNSFCSSSAVQDNHNQSTIQSTIDDQAIESDNDSQVVIVPGKVICISDTESAQNNFKSEYINDDILTKINYCSICKKKKNDEHDCSQFNKEFSTCLVPNCNILFRSTRDFTSHYRQHYGMPAREVMCRRCFKEKKKSECDENGCHTNCFTSYLFKCYECNVVFNRMAELAFHKLKRHINTARLINSSGNYLCFFCEKSSPDLMKINEHIQHCRKNQIESEKLKRIPITSKHALFTCLKPSCNIIFQKFDDFKFHHREHFEIGQDLMCWQCFSPFPTISSISSHQFKGNCRNPDMFECFECSKKYNDLQSLSIHKYVTHNGELISTKSDTKAITCMYCQTGVNIHDLKTHINECQSKEEKKMYPNLN